MIGNAGLPVNRGPIFVIEDVRCGMLHDEGSPPELPIYCFLTFESFLLLHFLDHYMIVW